MDPSTQVFKIVVLVQWFLAVVCLIHALRAGAGRLYALLGFIPYVGFIFLLISLAKTSQVEPRPPASAAGSFGGRSETETETRTYNCCAFGTEPCPAPSLHNHSGCSTCGGSGKVVCHICRGANDPRR
ncbi:MAG TPA: hypothetical protein VGH44_00335 [Candidatus Saccharimonadia bacterium]|jgi:hypothetical protein